MRSRAGIKFLIWTMLTLIICGGATWFVGQNFEKLGTYTVRRIAKKLHIKVPSPRPLTPAERAAAKAEAAAWKVKFLAEFPALMVAERPVAAEENGFLLLYQLGSSPQSDSLSISEEFKQILNGLAPWDPEAAKRCLTEHAELVSKIEHIAALLTRSSSNMPADYVGFISGRAGKNGCDILLLKARLAAEARDQTETLRLVSAAGNLGCHFHDIESPSLLSETISILIDLSIKRTAFKTLLPALGKSADLDQWKSELDRKIYSPTELAKVVRGEWNIGADLIAFPLLAISEKLREMPDAEAVSRCYSASYNQCVSKLPSRSFADLLTYDLILPGTVSHLSEEGRKIINDISIGSQSWSKGYVRSAAVHHQYQAAMELLIQEKTGATLTSAEADRVTRDPGSGLPFVFDAASRKLATPSSATALDLEPLALPW